jgi:hypothetical protein
MGTGWFSGSLLSTRGDAQTDGVGEVKILEINDTRSSRSPPDGCLDKSSWAHQQKLRPHKDGSFRFPGGVTLG